MPSAFGLYGTSACAQTGALRIAFKRGFRNLQFTITITITKLKLEEIIKDVQVVHQKAVD